MQSKQSDFSHRQAKPNADELFVQRWSPRAFSKQVIDPMALERIMQAARWSPSCFNDQPWRIYTSTEASFDAFLNLLVEGNQAWAKDTSVLGFVVAKLTFDHNDKPNAWAEFDCGAAWMSLSLQARMEGLYSHGMGGFHAEAAAEYLQLDQSNHKVVMAFALGHMAAADTLTAEQIEAEQPNQRKPLDEVWQQC